MQMLPPRSAADAGKNNGNGNNRAKPPRTARLLLGNDYRQVERAMCRHKVAVLCNRRMVPRVRVTARSLDALAVLIHLCRSRCAAAELRLGPVSSYLLVISRAKIDIDPRQACAGSPSARRRR